MANEDGINLDGVKALFFQESKELLEEMETCLLELEKNPDDDEILASLFRVVHTIKGSSGMFELDAVESFTHVLENVLDSARSHEIAINADLTSIIFECHDYISYLLDFSENNPDSELCDDKLALGNNLKARLQSCMPPVIDTSEMTEKTEEVEEADMASGEKHEAASSGEPSRIDTAVSECWHISLRFKPDVLMHGLDPSSFIHYLNDMGRVVKVKTVYDGLPPLSQMEIQRFYLGYEISFCGNASKESIINVFEFIQDDCYIRVLPPTSKITDFVQLIKELPEEDMAIGKILTSVGSLTENELEKALSLQEKQIFESSASGAELIGEILVKENMSVEPVVKAALDKQKQLRSSVNTKSKTIRIDSQKIDSLINLVGELVISSASIRQISHRLNDSELNESVSVMTRLVEGIRDGTMNVRMVPVGDTFRRFERIVRDYTKETGKEVRLEISGGDTELDKTLIDKISDPLMHLVRNALDHGIESPEERVRKGKSRQGRISLSAWHATGSFVIDVTDDGSGLNRDRILERAIERGLVDRTRAADISEEELFQCVFEPGFSTAEKVSSVSGRGVGMDVVKKNIESLRGTVRIKNNDDGNGTSARIRLPLTLAIIDGFLVQVGKGKYVVPLDMVTECLEVNKESLDLEGISGFYTLREEIVPVLNLRHFFECKEEREQRINVVIMEYAGERAGILVDKPLGEFQTVIKPLGRLFNKLQWLSGSTILGSGHVALILDAPRLIQLVRQLESTQQSA